MKNLKLKMLFRVLSLSLAFGVSFMSAESIAFSAHSFKGNDDVDAVVLFSESGIDDAAREIIEKSGGVILKEMPELGSIKVRCSDDVIDDLSNLDSVESLSSDSVLKIDLDDKINIRGNFENAAVRYFDDGDSDSEDDMFSGDLFDKYQWDIKKVTDNGRSFDIERGNHDVVIGIVDSGVDTDHPDLAENFLGGMNFVPENFMGDESESGDVNDVEDRFGHGTNVAGQIAADGKCKGVAPGIGFKSYRVFNEYGETTASICADAIKQAVDDKVNVINLSMNGFYLKGKLYDNESGKYEKINESADLKLLKRAVKYAAKHNVVVVASTGNEGLNCSDDNEILEYHNMIYGMDNKTFKGSIYQAPGVFDGVINVGSSDKNDNVACYSNYGRKIVDVAAPAGDITGELDNMCMTTAIDDGYTFSLGTSLSAPKVSALAGLILCKDKKLSAKKVEKKIYQYADIINKENAKDYYGAGIINVCRTLEN